ncbi:MAG: pilus assembly protein, partial [Hyphomicrobiales bacterium]|nr:pilus assembly protein [Hyphomicrobiales bacterium]
MPDAATPQKLLDSQVATAAGGAVAASELLNGEGCRALNATVARYDSTFISFEWSRIEFGSMSYRIIRMTNDRIKPVMPTATSHGPSTTTSACAADSAVARSLAWNEQARIFRGAVARAVRDETGVGAVEFALIAPLLLGISLAALIFALALNNYILVTNASTAGATNFILSRGSTTPYSDTVTAVRQAAQGLTSANLTIAMSVDGAACADDSSCATALSAAGGKQANVAVSY